LVFLQIFLGGLVAGLDAGQGYNTWPLMDGALVPDGLGAMRPWYLNLFENALTVQFQHRMAAYAVAVWALLQLWAVSRGAEAGPVRLSAVALAIAVLCQTGLGIWTLLAHAPLDLSLAHQGGAILVFAIALAHLHALVHEGRGAVRTQSFAKA
jgi:cytochrome c oxidase assembly protein subunit 15